MKQIQILVAVLGMFSLNGVLSAGEMLDIKGNFGELKNGLPAGWYPNKPRYWEDTATISLSEIPETGKFALKVTSQSQTIHIFSILGTSPKKWPITTGGQCIIKAKIKGHGEGGLGVYSYPSGQFQGKDFQATEEWTEFIAELTMGVTKPEVEEICIVLMIGPGASVEFSDVTAEIVAN
jgi:hypothetical protein